MLILTRRANEEIKISPDITIRILSSSDSQVKIGIDAPPDVQILRGEIFDKIVQSTVDASAQSKIKVNDVSALKLNKIGGSDGKQ
ncbi:MAG: carbon storage regulator [Ignavibacteriaceae bacterium]